MKCPPGLVTQGRALPRCWRCPRATTEQVVLKSWRRQRNKGGPRDINELTTVTKTADVARARKTRASTAVPLYTNSGEAVSVPPLF